MVLLVSDRVSMEGMMEVVQVDKGAIESSWGYLVNVELLTIS